MLTIPADWSVFVLQGVTMPRLVHSFNWLKQELKMRNRDVAFCGESDVVVEYAEALLGTDLITRK